MQKQDSTLNFAQDIKYTIIGRNPEKFYKITEKGLRAILEVKIYQEEFWRAIILLCIYGNEPISEAEFEEYYRKFEYDFLGHLDIQASQLFP